MLKILTILTILTGVLNASDLSVYNIVSFTKIEEILFNFFIGLQSILVYIIYDVIGVHFLFVIIAALVFLWKFTFKAVTFQFSQLFTFLFNPNKPYNNILTKYFIYLFIVSFILNPVDVNMYKIQQDEGLRHGFYVSDLKSFDGDSTTLDLKEYLSYIGVKNNIEIKRRAFKIGVAPFNFGYSVLMGLPYKKNIEEGQLVKHDAGVFGISLIHIIDDWFGFNTVTKEFNRFLYEPSSLIDDAVNFMPKMTKTTADKETTRKILSNKLITLNNNLEYFTKVKEAADITKNDLLHYEYLDFLNSGLKDFKEYSDLFLGGSTVKKIEMLESQKLTYEKFLKNTEDKLNKAIIILTEDFKNAKVRGFNLVFNKVLSMLGVGYLQFETMENSFKFKDSFHNIKFIDNTYKENILRSFVLSENDKKSKLDLIELQELRAYFFSIVYKNGTIARFKEFNENITTKTKADYKKFFNKNNKFLQSLFLIKRNLIQKNTKTIIESYIVKDLELKPLQLRKEILIDLLQVVPGDSLEIKKQTNQIILKLENIDKELYKKVIEDLRSLAAKKKETSFLDLTEIKNNILKISYKRQLEQHRYLKKIKFIDTLLIKHFEDLNKNFDIQTLLGNYIDEIEHLTTHDKVLEMYPTKGTIKINGDFKTTHVIPNIAFKDSYIKDLTKLVLKDINKIEKVKRFLPLSFMQHNIYSNKVDENLEGYKFFKMNTTIKNVNLSVNSFNVKVYEEIKKILEEQDPYKKYLVEIANKEDFYKSAPTIEIAKKWKYGNNHSINFLGTQKTDKDYLIFEGSDDIEIFKKSMNRLMPSQRDNTIIIRTHLGDLLTAHRAIYGLIDSYKETETGWKIISENNSVTGFLMGIYNNIEKDNTEPLIKGHLNTILQKKLKWLYRFPFEGNYKTKETEEKTTLTLSETATAGATTLFLMDMDSTMIKLGSLAIITGNKLANTDVAGESQKSFFSMGGFKDRMNSIKDAVVSPIETIQKKGAEYGIKLVTELFLMFLTIAIFYNVVLIFIKFVGLLKDMLIKLSGLTFDLVYKLIKTDDLIELSLEYEKDFKDIIIKSSVVIGFYIVFIVGAISINGYLQFIFVTNYESKFMAGDTPDYETVMDAVGYLSFIAFVGWYSLRKSIFKMFMLEATQEEQLINNGVNSIQNKAQDINNKKDILKEKATQRVEKIKENVNNTMSKMRDENGKINIFGNKKNKSSLGGNLTK